MDHIGSQVRKGFQSEKTAGKLGMRNLQAVGCHNAVFIEENIEIDRPGRPVAFICTAEFAFYRFEEIEEAFRLETGFDFEDAVEKFGLAWLARAELRLSLIKSRNTSDVSP